MTKDTKLESLWTKFDRLVKNYSFDKKATYINELKKFTQIKAMVLNPLSHHDLESPLYAAEVENAIGFYKWLTGFEFVKKINANETIQLRLENGYVYNFLVKDHFYVLKYNHQTCGFSKHRLQPKNYTKTDGKCCDLSKQKEGALSEHFPKISHCLKLPIKTNWYSKLFHNENQLLNLLELNFFEWLKNESQSNPQYKDLYEDALVCSKGYPELPPAPTSSNNFYVWRKHLLEHGACNEAKDVLRDAFNYYYGFVKAIPFDRGTCKESEKTD